MPATAQYGLAFPYTAIIAEEQDLNVQLLKIWDDQNQCILQIPSFSIIDLKQKNEKYDFWGEGCSVKIRNIKKDHEDIWRLISFAKNGRIEGVFSIIVKNNTAKVIENIHINISDDVTPNSIDFVTQNVSYCYISQKQIHKDFIFGHKCSLSFKEIGKSSHGIYKVNIGIPGKIDEEKFESNIQLNVESMNVGYISLDKNIHMYCNVQNSNKNMSFCRFERMNDEKGFNLKEGLGKDRYSYYGGGFYKKECGLTIEQPNNEDYDNWRCSIGLTSNFDSLKILQRVIMLHKPGYRLIKNEIKEIISVNNKMLKIKCQANVTISYCSVKHPNGTEFVPVIYEDETSSEIDKPYWYSYKKLDIGECELNIKITHYQDSGEWICYMGNSLSPGLELIDKILVRIGGELAAINSVISITYNKSLTIHCITASGNFPLKYCKFLLPDGTRLNIDETVTPNKPVLENYFFPQDASLFRGDCAISVFNTSKNHVGKWKCAAMIESEMTEYNDIIMVIFEDEISSASVAGISIGIVMIIILGGVFGMYMWKKKHIFSRTNIRPATDENVVHYDPRSSEDSQNSEIELTTRPTGAIQISYGTTTDTS